MCGHVGRRFGRGLGLQDDIGDLVLLIKRAQRVSQERRRVVAGNDHRHRRKVRAQHQPGNRLVGFKLHLDHIADLVITPGEVEVLAGELRSCGGLIVDRKMSGQGHPVDEQALVSARGNQVANVGRNLRIAIAGECRTAYSLQLARQLFVED